MANFGVLRSGDLSVISTASNSVVATIAMGAESFGVAITPNGKFVYVANFDRPMPAQNAGKVVVIATASNRVVATIAVGVTPKTWPSPPMGNSPI